MLPRLLILYTGGTFGMELSRKTPAGKKNASILARIPDLSSSLLKKRVIESVPELSKIARCDVEVILNRDSAHIGPDEWTAIAKTIQSSWKNYDGIVVLHGTDTLAYTASALSFLLRPCLKPVVMTGAQRPLSAIRSDARTNLISAAEIAAYGPRNLVTQVTVFFGNELFQGNRIRKKSSSDYSAFESPYCSPLAVFGTTNRYGIGNELPNQRLGLKPRFSKKVLIAHLTPGFPSQTLNKYLLSRLEGLVLVVFASGTAPTHDPEFVQLLSAAKSRKIPVIAVTQDRSQLPARQSQGVQYQAGSELNIQGCLSADLMTPECAYVKTALLLGQTRDHKEFVKLWNSNLANER